MTDLEPGIFEPSETAVLCVLMLRGAQTLGELRERTHRLYEFSGLGDVQETLDALIRREEPFIVKLERLPGQKEARFAHLLCQRMIFLQLQIVFRLCRLVSGCYATVNPLLNFDFCATFCRLFGGQNVGNL